MTVYKNKEQTVIIRTLDGHTFIHKDTGDEPYPSKIGHDYPVIMFRVVQYLHSNDNGTYTKGSTVNMYIPVHSITNIEVIDSISIKQY